ncbi:hypothetical protein ISF_05750 [Cordyceps fumosorosea ARSEF 2679]|uniref:DUF1279 domain-containing protein n=1 Tax=Cordyceps fumosorosea (strain ARSEF 2679) TaxID=1081104 RepID=A0A167TL57_CORFA|nr:hypothetical protein ISF_05750 [Cordyceps fumosorosea ARSEF 2679]OAA60711.1 hypothetical protein ISF_05750 [Cordyceps fumosorosea ARSEF 2679]
MALAGRPRLEIAAGPSRFSRLAGTPLANELVQYHLRFEQLIQLHLKAQVLAITMLRYLLQGSGLAQQGSNTIKAPLGAWQGAWKRLYTTTQRSVSRHGSISSKASRLSATAFHPLRHVGLRTAAAPGWTPASRRGFRFTAWRRNAANGEKAESLSLSQRLKKLFKDYGKSAIGVYLALSVLDFPFCFLLVRVVGTDTIGKIEHAVVSTVSNFIPESIRQKWRDYWQSVKKTETDALGNGDVSGTVEMMSWGVEKAQEHHNEEASLGTQLALAYAIHKSFIFLRVPLTAALTPKIVKKLRSWGWNIGKKA